jgi:UDP-N-acetylmuramate dehydrogenase
VAVNQAYFSFDYRWSILKTQHDVLLQVTLGVYKAARYTMEIIIEDNLEKREQRHPPWEIACAGSYFKNPILETGEKTPAASLLDQIGAKDMRVGGAFVYAHHANFIINTGGATSQDVLSLASDLKQRVKEKFNIELEEEVIHLRAEIPMP